MTQPDQPPSETTAQIDGRTLDSETLDAERKKWLTVDEAAYVMGVSRASILKLVREQPSVARRFGRYIRIHIDDLRPVKPMTCPMAHAHQEEHHVPFTANPFRSSSTPTLDEFDANRPAHIRRRLGRR